MPVKTYEDTIHKDLIQPLKEECSRINDFVTQSIKTHKDGNYTTFWFEKDDEPKTLIESNRSLSSPASSGKGAFEIIFLSISSLESNILIGFLLILDFDISERNFLFLFKYFTKLFLYISLNFPLNR